jgi:hypothetical protein
MRDVYLTQSLDFLIPSWSCQVRIRLFFLNLTCLLILINWSIKSGCILWQSDSLWCTNVREILIKLGIAIATWILGQMTLVLSYVP